MPDRDGQIERIEEHLAELRLSADFIDSNTTRSLSETRETGREIANAINNLGNTLLPALLIGGLMGGLMAGRREAEAKLLDFTLEILKELRQKSSMIKSILHLQKHHTHLTYRLLLERAAVRGASMQDRRDILNELIAEEILIEYPHDEATAIRIDAEGCALKAYRKKEEGVFEALSKVKL